MPIEVISDLLATRRAALSEQQLVMASEIALRAQAFDVAVAAMQAAVALSPLDGALYHRLGLCQMRADMPGAAAASLARSIACAPDTPAAYQSLIAIALAEDDTGSALFHARAQARACGSTPQLIMQTVGILTRDKRPQDAFHLVQRLNAGPDASPQTLRLEAELANQLGMAENAIATAQRLCSDGPEESGHAYFLAQLLYNHERFDDAAGVLKASLRHETTNPRLFRLLSAALARTGAGKPALAAAISAVQLAPEASEYWYHAAMLAHTLGFTRQASELAAKATELDPDNAQVWAAYARLLQSLEKVDEAVQALDRALAIRPEDTALRDFRIYVLTARRATIGLEDAGERPIKPMPRSRDRRSPEASGEFALTMRALGVQCRVLSGLTSRAIGHRTIQSRFGLLSTLFEPLVQVLAVGTVLALFNHSRPPIGNFFFFFYATGLLPLYLFIHVCNHTLNVFREQQTLLQVPIIKRLDLVIGESLAEFVICGMTTLITFGGFQLLGYAPASDNQMQAVEAYLVLFALAFGFGLTGAVINNYFPVYLKIWSVLQRFLYFVSGVIIMAEHMPLWVRAYAVWNPLLLLITWFRGGFFPQYAPPWLDRNYVVVCAFALVTFGLVLERATRRHMKLM